jgi:quercetin dioxygenase-like cupin family protein
MLLEQTNGDRPMKSRLAFLCIAAFASAFSNVDAAELPTVKATPLLTKALEGIEGKEGLMLTVELPPGAESPPHRHNANTFVYVLEGSVIMQVHGGEEKTLTVGQTFYESPSDVHTVSRNASKTSSAKILVLLVKPTGAPVTMPVK